jgi:hypothetical protein
MKTSKRKARSRARKPSCPDRQAKFVGVEPQITDNLRDIMRVVFISPLMILLSVAPIAQARIGETEPQIDASYGKPVAQVPSQANDLGLTKLYHSGSYMVFVTFLEGQSVREMFAKRDRSDLSQDELQALLNANSGGHPWESESHPVRREGAPPGAQEWRSLDQRSRVGFYNPNTSSLFIATQDFIDRLNVKAGRTAAIQMAAGGQ